MLNYLVDKIIGTRDFSKKENRDKLIRLSGLMGLFINILLFIMKIAIGLLSSSIAIISDSINNLSDGITSVITIVGSKMAAKPADKNHPFGHGRSEYIASMIVGFFVFYVGVELFKNSIDSIRNPQPVDTGCITIIILLVSIALKIYMYSYNMAIYKECDSLLNKSVARDSINDVLATGLVLLSVILGSYVDFNIDGWVGLLISGIVIKSGIEIFVEIADVLMGKKIDPDLTKKIKKIILDSKYIKGVHKIEIHEYGKGRLFGSCHVEAPANIDVYSMHTIVNNIENEILEKLGVDLSIHVDPSYNLDEDKFERVAKEDLLVDIDD